MMRPLNCYNRDLRESESTPESRAVLLDSSVCLVLLPHCIIADKPDLK